MAISAKEVGELRASTGAGLMDCKKALEEAGGNKDKAVEILRKKGVASAEKKAGRDASEGLIEQYIHLGGKVGVLLELNCETDFVAKNEDFKALARDICMHVAAVNPAFVRRDEIPEDDEELLREKEAAESKAEGKPEQAKTKIVEGLMNKFYANYCLLDQAFVKNSDLSVQEHVNAAITKLGENIMVKRFVRYEIGQ